MAVYDLYGPHKMNAMPFRTPCSELPFQRQPLPCPPCFKEDNIYDATPQGFCRGSPALMAVVPVWPPAPSSLTDRVGTNIGQVGQEGATAPQHSNIGQVGQEGDIAAKMTLFPLPGVTSLSGGPPSCSAVLSLLGGL